MNIHELEIHAYDRLRCGDLLAAVHAVLAHATAFEGADHLDLLCLRANVLMMCGVRNYAECSALLDAVLSAAETRPTTRLKGHLLGAKLCFERHDHHAWEWHLQGLRRLAPAFPAWSGRIRLAYAQYHECFGSAEAALARHLKNVTWHQRNTGPYDERDRLCYLGLSQGSVATLLLKVGQLDRAGRYLQEVEQNLPADADQRIFLLLAQGEHGLCAHRLATTERAIEAAKAWLLTHPNRYAELRVQELLGRALIAKRAYEEAEMVVRGLIRAAYAEEQRQLLRSGQALLATLTQRRVSK